MKDGEILSIYIRPGEGQPMRAMDQVRAVPGRGLEGDHYYYSSATTDTTQDSSREVTLIELETLQAAKRDYELNLELGESRRNLITRNVPLNHLVGKEFQVGDVRLLGVRLCEPCSHLASLTNKPVIKPLVHRGGLRAKILSEGLIRVGDSVVNLEE
jgi:MOSC domain-containing protein YiiM